VYCGPEKHAALPTSAPYTSILLVVECGNGYTLYVSIIDGGKGYSMAMHVNTESADNKKLSLYRVVFSTFWEKR
jgi:hypothetical protein